ncbi:type VI immunity family protein [Acinetobacter tandoii]
MDALEFEKNVNDAEYINYDLGENGEIVLSVHFQSCFYLWNGHTTEVRHAIANCYTRYMALWGEYITWGFDPLSNWKQKAFDRLPTLHDVLKKLSSPDDAIEWYVADGGCENNEIDHANKFVFSVLTSRAWKIQEGSIVTFRIPRHLYFQENSKKQILEFNQYCIEQLQPWYVVSGMQAATPFSDSGIKFDLVSQARDFKGIYLEKVWDSVRMAYGIRSFDWLTYISGPLSEKVGGIKNLENALKKARIKFEHLSSGLLVQVTEHPELIPSGEEIPSNYLKFNNILRPMRDGNYGSMGDGTYLGENDQSFDIRLTDLWMRRFDFEYVWSDLISVVKSRKPKSVVKLVSNQVCQMSGRYRFEEDYDYIRNEPLPFEDADSRENDYRSYIILNKGDIAPYYLKLDQYGNLIERSEIAWTLFEEFNY